MGGFSLTLQAVSDNQPHGFITRHDQHSGSNAGGAMPRFIRKKYDVENIDETVTHTLGGHAGDMTGDSLESSRVFLVGLRGAGKSTVGRVLAKRLGLSFSDLDDVVEEQAGKTIAEIVGEQGWEAFRSMEHEALKAVCTGSGIVVAPGGGIVLDERNRKLMESCGKVIYLMADIPLLMSRLERNPGASQRPSLSGQPLEEEVLDCFREREPLYMMLMDYSVPAELPVEEIVDLVAEYLQGR